MSNNNFLESMTTDSDNFDELELQKPVYTEQEIIEKLGHSAYQFEVASNFLIKYSAQIEKRKAKIRSKILSKSIEMIENSALKAHLIVIFENEKLRLTKEDIEGFINIELGEISEQMSRAEIIAKRAEKSHDMWSRQISYYQSILKKETAEIMALNMQKG